MAMIKINTHFGMMTYMEMREFQEVIWRYYDTHYRPMPWRDNTDPYWILVSEIMLQQTQVSRVIPKFHEFVESFPTINNLADASFQEVLKHWSGLGYNRRAKFLHQAAQVIVRDYDGAVPKNRTQLESLPGVGPNTAGAILVYAHNQPEVFIETNIRSVFIHHFFKDAHNVDDKELMPLIQQTVPKDNPRQWYWALMDYGTHLKSTLPNPSRSSKHHTKQSKFEGSDRQIRGQVLKLLVDGPVSLESIKQSIDDPRIESIMESLQKEKLIKISQQTASIM